MNTPIPQWLVDVRIQAGVLAALADQAIADPAIARDFQIHLRGHARQLIEAIEDARREEVPESATVLPLRKKA